MELVCFSTARSDTDTATAMAALFLPWAISARICVSRGVRSLSADWLVPLAGGVSALGLAALLVRSWVQSRVRRRPNPSDTTLR